MRFHAIVSTASEPDGLAINDWIPLDAESWSVLEAVKARGCRGGGLTAAPRIETEGGRQGAVLARDGADQP